ncbi:MAG: flavin reductase family protein [Lautropia sp.]
MRALRDPESETPDLRRALARFAAGVVVVACRAEGGSPHCVIASAFNSVSLAPALLLWCVPSSSRRWLGIDRAYGLSVLSVAQASLLNLQDLQATPLAWESGELLGAPLLRDAAAWFEVVAAHRIENGDHDLYLAQVAGLGYSTRQTGLLRYSGQVVRSGEIAHETEHRQTLVTR